MKDNRYWDDANKCFVSGQFVKTHRTDERKKAINEISTMLTAMLNEPAYQHCGEDWFCGVTSAIDKISEIEAMRCESRSSEPEK